MQKLFEAGQSTSLTPLPLSRLTTDALTDALSPSQLEYIVLDLMKDSKKRNLLDLPEARLALFKLLTVPAVRSRLVSGDTKLVLY